MSAKPSSPTRRGFLSTTAAGPGTVAAGLLAAIGSADVQTSKAKRSELPKIKPNRSPRPTRAHHNRQALLINRTRFGADISFVWHACGSGRQRMQAPANNTDVHSTSGARIAISRQELVEAIARVSRRDRAAFELVYAATSAKLYGIIIRILGRRDLADDVLQEVYIRVWQHAAEFDPSFASPITWLATIARNCALDEIKLKAMRLLDDCPEAFVVPNSDNPLDDYGQDEARRCLQACLDRLGPEKKDVVLQAYYYGMTREEIATQIGQPVSTVKMWLRRSLAELRGYLGE
jgi:RNA polymerase sigma-70 factor, ECF subfamily